ncbi:hypothetical protein ACLOJK_039185 [Asimina triloba]
MDRRLTDFARDFISVDYFAYRLKLDVIAADEICVAALAELAFDEEGENDMTDLLMSAYRSSCINGCLDLEEPIKGKKKAINFLDVALFADFAAHCLCSPDLMERSC